MISETWLVMKIGVKIRLWREYLMFKQCSHCKTRLFVTTQYNGWRYEDDVRNYSTLCKDCWPELNEYVNSMWSDYYSSCM